MCTVSFVPLTERRFILTSNRDETVKRGLASIPLRFQYEGTEIICPQDPLAHGSWIAAAEDNRLTCLLNGAFKRDKRELPYRKSRGIVVLDSLTSSSAEEFAVSYDFTNIEPFTMVMVNNHEKLLLHELRWDGISHYFKALNENEFHLWSSVTLYSDALIKEKERMFKILLENLEEVTPFTVSALHEKYFLYEDWVKSPERVEEVATLSVTGVECSHDLLLMHYRDLVRKESPLTTLAFIRDQS